MEAEARRAAAGPRRITHNCSGKHAGMLLACERSGANLARYLEPSHPLQREILRAVGSATGVDRPVVGVDGCGAPVHGLPLRGMATLFARLARPERLARNLIHSTEMIKYHILSRRHFLLAIRDML